MLLDDFGCHYKELGLGASCVVDLNGQVKVVVSHGRGMLIGSRDLGACMHNSEGRKTVSEPSQNEMEIQSGTLRNVQTLTIIGAGRERERERERERGRERGRGGGGGGGVCPFSQLWPMRPHRPSS